MDYWAFGILIYEMQAGFSPFSDSQGECVVVISISLQGLVSIGTGRGLHGDL